MTNGPEKAEEVVHDMSEDVPEDENLRETGDEEDTLDAEHEDAEHGEPVDAEHEESEDASGREGMTQREQTPGTGAVRIPPQAAGIVSAGARDVEPGADAVASGKADADVRGTAGSDVGGPLLTEAEELRSSWQRVMTEFVDDPRGSVARAASMVEETAETLVATIKERERLLRSAWEGNGTAADTENLRIALRKYRTFFEKITSL